MIGLARDTPSTSSAAALEAVLFAALVVLEALLEAVVLAVVEAVVLEALAEAAALEVLFALDCPPQPTVNTMVAQRSAATRVFLVFIFLSSVLFS